MRVIISGQKYFGAEVLRLCLNSGLGVVAVCAPLDDKYITPLARVFEIPVIPAGTLCAETMPPQIDLGIAAHSFDYIGKKTRYRALLGWIGYHPSLLPRHRGRSSVEWAIRMRDAVTGGTVFWLNGGIDRGDIAYQDWCFINPALYAKNPQDAAAELWREELMPMGLRLLSKALLDIKRGVIVKTPQDDRFSTFEPNTDVKDLFKPDLDLLPAPGGYNGLTGGEKARLAFDYTQ